MQIPWYAFVTMSLNQYRVTQRKTEDNNLQALLQGGKSTAKESPEQTGPNIHKMHNVLYYNTV